MSTGAIVAISLGTSLAAAAIIYAVTRPPPAPPPPPPGPFGLNLNQLIGAVEHVAQAGERYAQGLEDTGSSGESYGAP